jgi:hypothetical protein
VKKKKKAEEEEEGSPLRAKRKTKKADEAAVRSQFLG